MANMYDGIEIVGNGMQGAENPYEDRITAILQKRSQAAQQPEFTSEQQDYAGNAAVNYALAGQNRGVQDIYESIRAPRIAQEERQISDAGMLYNMFEEKRARGDKQAQALYDRISMFTGDDPDGMAMILNELHNDPEPIDPSNPYQVMTKVAGIVKRNGYQSPERNYDRQLQDLTLQEKRASIAKMGQSSSADLPADVQSFQYLQSLSPEEQQSFLQMKGKGAGLKPTEMKEIFDQEDVINAASDSLSILAQMEALNAMPTYEGPAAAQRAGIGKLSGSTEALNTLEIENLGQNLAASMLKTTFTGAISNAEREFLQQLQASANKTVAERTRIMNNGKALIQKRAERAQQKQARIQSGEYQTTPAGMSTTTLGATGNIDIDNMTEQELDDFIASQNQ